MEQLRPGVVVLTYGRANTHRALIDQLDAAGFPNENVVVVHNSYGPSDPWVPVVPAGATVIRTERNLGYAGGMNQGIAEQLGRGASRILLLTHDVRLEPGCTDHLQRALDEDVCLGIVGPALEDRRTGSLWSLGGVDNPKTGLVRHRLSGHGRVITTQWVDGAVVLARAKALRTVGGLDPSLFMYYEECELCLRVRRAGWTVGVVTEARASCVPGGLERPGVHSYLLARNGLTYAIRAGGWQRAIRAFWFLLRTGYSLMPKPLGERIRDPPRRQEAGLRSLATLLGIWDFVRRRSGPPPAWLSSKSDVIGT